MYLIMILITDYNVTVIKYPNSGSGKVVSIDLYVEEWPNTSNNKRVSTTYVQEKTFYKKRSERLYLGGAPTNAVSTLTDGLYSRSFNGCISNLKISKKTEKHDFFFKFDFTSGRGVVKRERVSCEETCMA